MNGVHGRRPRPIARPGLLLCGLVATAHLWGCGDDAKPSDTADTSPEAEVEDLTGRSLYRLETEVNGTPITLERELTGSTQYFAFGSTHIAPAVSFAMTDSVTFPRTMTVNLNFGIVIGSDTLSVHTTEAKLYAFSASPPEVKVFVAGLQYSSKEPGATGEIDITQWSTETGEPVAGTFSGTLVAEGNASRTLPVSGSFFFTLPEQNAGQPQ
ncbi:MAG TPA: hypothetical protein PK095_18945 [Myxococcota bacterium]|nr:hypothetical protein [Myxococcota bacterium]